MLNIQDFLLPISDEKPCGLNLRYDVVYDDIQEYRREDDKDLSQGIWQKELKKANWTEVKRLCVDLLKTRTKDLQIAVWLTQALVALDGISGLNDGILLITALSKTFWNDIYPENNVQDASYRLAPFFFLIEKIRDRLILLPITDASDSATITYSLADWVMARHNLKIKNTKGISLKQIGKSVTLSSIDFFVDLSKKLIQLTTNINELDRFLTDKYGTQSPNFREITECIEDIQRITGKNCEEKRKQIITEQKTANKLPDTNDSIDDVTPVEPLKPKVTLEQAYVALTDVAAFLEREQPQSPAAILVKIASIIGKKTFRELLEIHTKSGIPVMTAISELYKTLGGSTPKSNESGTPQ